MLSRHAAMFMIVAVTAVPLRAPMAAPAADPATPVPVEISTRIDRLRTSAHTRDSLTARADTTSGAGRDILEEMIWQRHLEVHTEMFDLAAALKTAQQKGQDLTAAREAVKRLIGDEWPRDMQQLRRRQDAMNVLRRTSDAAAGTQRLALESEITQKSDRLLEAYRSVTDAVLALERAGVDVSEQRTFIADALQRAAEGLVTRLQLADRERTNAGARLSRDASNADLRYAFEASEERLKRASSSLSTAIEIMDRMGLEGTDMRVALIAMTGRMTTDVFRWKVLLGLLRNWWSGVVEVLVVKAPQWLFQALLVGLTFLGFRALSKLAQRVVRRAVKHSKFSELLRGTIVRLSAVAVMLIGFLVILTQLGVQVAPLLAGLGIAGFVVGFAMQNTLSNFAAGGMILGNQPFDVGDEIEVAGVTGIVQRMTLVSTTILTPDNQTLIIPNSAVWGGVIRNRTTQPTRRVDLVFGIGYGDDIAKAERVLTEIVAAHPNILADPAPVVRLNQLADSSVNFVVRVWTTRERFLDVQWDLLRSVKLRFDEEGISIPFPQRDVHLTLAGGEGAGTVTLGPPGKTP